MPLLEQFKPDIMTFPQEINRPSLLDTQATYSYILPTLKASRDQLNRLSERIPRSLLRG